MICSSPVLDVFDEVCCLTVAVSSPLLVESDSFAGEIGMVSRGTGELGFAGPFREGACRAAMMCSLSGSKKTLQGGCSGNQLAEFVCRHCSKDQRTIEQLDRVDLIDEWKTKSRKLHQAEVYSYN